VPRRRKEHQELSSRCSRDHRRRLRGQDRGNKAGCNKGVNRAREGRSNRESQEQVQRGTAEVAGLNLQEDAQWRFPVDPGLVNEATAVMEMRTMGIL